MPSLPVQVLAGLMHLQKPELGCADSVPRGRNAILEHLHSSCAQSGHRNSGTSNADAEQFNDFGCEHGKMDAGIASVAVRTGRRRLLSMTLLDSTTLDVDLFISQLAQALMQKFPFERWWQRWTRLDYSQNGERWVRKGSIVISFIDVGISG